MQAYKILCQFFLRANVKGTYSSSRSACALVKRRENLAMILSACASLRPFLIKKGALKDILLKKEK
jgi:hypothetical protein